MAETETAFDEDLDHLMAVLEEEEIVDADRELMADQYARRHRQSFTEEELEMYRDAELMRENLSLIPAPLYSRARMPEHQNVVSNSSLGHSVDLFKFLRDFPCTDFRFTRFPAASYRSRPPVGLVVRVFPNGKTTTLGASMPEETELGLQDMRQALYEKGHTHYELCPLFTSNMVASFRLQYYVRINEVNHQDEIGFVMMKKLFPGLIYRNISPKVTLLIFETGSVMVLGARTYSAILQAVENVHVVLKNYAVDRNSPAAEEFRTNTRRGTRGRKAVGPDGLTDDQRMLLAQARIDDPEAFEKQLAAEEMKRLANAVKSRKRAALSAASKQAVNTKEEFEALIDRYYDDLVERDRKRRAKRHTEPEVLPVPNNVRKGARKAPAKKASGNKRKTPDSEQLPLV